MPIPLLAPMLATAGLLGGRHEWKVEPKLDGWRALVYIDGGLLLTIGQTGATPLRH